MAIPLDHVGLNTLIIDSGSVGGTWRYQTSSNSQNILGFTKTVRGQTIPDGALSASYVNTVVGKIKGRSADGNANTSITNDHAGGVFKDYLVGLNTHRNGPYGYPSWKQMRTADNPITRYHNKNMQFSFLSKTLGTPFYYWNETTAGQILMQAGWAKENVRPHRRPHFFALQRAGTQGVLLVVAHASQSGDR